MRRASARATIIAAAACAACGNSPSYAVPPEHQAATALQTIQVTSVQGQTVAAGVGREDLCVLQSLSGHFHTYDPDAGPQTGVSLYLDGTSQWQLAVDGDVQATAACANFASFGYGTAVVMQVENGSEQTDAAVPTTATSLPAGWDCYLSQLEGSFDAPGASAQIADSTLQVSQPAGGVGWAAATCFEGLGPVSFEDIPIDAGTDPTIVTLPPASQALCGLTSVQGLADEGSGVAIHDGIAIANQAAVTFRCFVSLAADAGIAAAPSIDAGGD